MNEIDFDVKCTHCKASLKGISLTEACRKCGQLVGATIDLRLMDPAEMKIKADRSCVGCGYNLRSLGVGTICPECAKPVAVSLRPNELWSANRDWLLGVRQGVKMLFISGIGIPAISFSLIFIGQLVSSDVVRSLSFAFGGLGLLVLALLTIVGVVNAASREENRPSRDESHWPHTLACVTVLLPIVFLVGGVILLQIVATTTGSVFPMMSMAMVLFAGTLSVCPICTALCLRRVARRSTHQSLATVTTVWIRIAAFVAPLIIAQFGILVFATTGGGSSSAGWVWMMVGILSFVWWAGLLLLYLMGMVGLFVYTRMLNEAVAQPQLPVAVPVAGDYKTVPPPAAADYTPLGE